nr:uncharacterized protein CI109_005243 [Kwoniella shandongensis]KAA5526473.1 hypothetical protein CI109_005243 [Kwoniella shandongensis]
MSYYDLNAFIAPPSPPLSKAEQERIPALAQQSYIILAEEFGGSMTLGEFAAELRDLNLRSSVIDDIITYMSTNGWAHTWKNEEDDDTWISVAEQ